MKKNNFIEVYPEKFHEFLNEILPIHNVSSLIIDELAHRRFHHLSSFKKDFINEILKNYYGMYYIGFGAMSQDSKYQFSVVDKKLCTFFLLKYEN